MNQIDRESLYQQLIMDRARSPRYAGIVEFSQGAADGNNPFCGDKTHITVAFSPNKCIKQVMHQTRGCAICAASADLMSERVYGLDEIAVLSLFKEFDAMLNQGISLDSVQSTTAELGILRAFENLHEYRSRIRCATLPWSALFDALKNKKDK